MNKGNMPMLWQKASYLVVASADGKLSIYKNWRIKVIPVTVQGVKGTELLIPSVKSMLFRYINRIWIINVVFEKYVS